jgi:hypothetical protein
MYVTPTVSELSERGAQLNRHENTELRGHIQGAIFVIYGNGLSV